jgi:transmembrane sensor
MASHKEIEDRAAAWLAKRDGGNWSPEDQVQFTHWLGESIAHRVAFLRLEDAWDVTRRLKALGAGRAPGIVPRPGQWRSPPFFDSRRPLPGSTEVDSSPELASLPEATQPTDDILSGQAMLDEGRFDKPAAESPESSSWRVGQREPTICQDEESMSLDAIHLTVEDLRRTALLPQTAGYRHGAGTGLRFWVIAASVLLVLSIGSYLAFSPSADHYSTPIGTITSVPLRDGSSVTLNTASEVRVELTPNERLIDLQQGEAFFKVAKDPTRPFVVRVDDQRVVAVGTQFSVRRDGDYIRIVVTEGTVRLESANSARSGSKGSGPKVDSISRDGADVGLADGSAASASTSLPAGTIARARDEDVLVVRESVSQVEELLSWRQGYLRFRDTTLAQAIEEFNRYNARSITIDDPTIAAIRISGTFRPTNYEAFVRLLGDGYSIRAEDKGDHIILTRY